MQILQVADAYTQNAKPSSNALMLFDNLIERFGQQMLPVNVIDRELEAFSTPTEDLIAVKQNVKRSLLSRKSFIGAMAVSCIWSFHDMTYSEVFHLTYNITNVVG
jgi:hypothetical protein